MDVLNRFEVQGKNKLLGPNKALFIQVSVKSIKVFHAIATVGDLIEQKCVNTLTRMSHMKLLFT